MVLIYALLGGILPALVWLWFWLHEDKKRPEPRGRLALTFIAGMASVFVVLPLEELVQSAGLDSFFLLFLFWAIIEEALKFLFAYAAALHGKDMDEPVDAVIYMVTAALGFAAIENALFLLSPISGGLVLESIITGNMRFIGATALHTLASGVLGAFIGFSFYKNSYIKAKHVFYGLVVATLLHTAFNFFIITNTRDDIFTIFAGVWFALVVLIAVFERVKRVYS